MPLKYIVAMAALPAIVAMAYVDRLDRRRPEPPTLLRKTAFVGALMAIPAILVEMVLAHFAPREAFASSLFTAYVVAALTEEAFKFLAMYLVAWKQPAFDERLDGVVYATRAALGFALVENIGYLLRADAGGNLLSTAIVRALLCVPGHAIFTGYAGLFAARRRFDKRGIGMIGGLLLAIFLHGSYDAALMVQGTADGVWPLLFVPLIVVGFGGYLLHRFARRAGADDRRAETGRIAETGHRGATPSADATDIDDELAAIRRRVGVFTQGGSPDPTDLGEHPDPVRFRAGGRDGG